MRRPIAALVAVLALTALAAPADSSASTPRSCGPVGPRAERDAYLVKVPKGKVRCAEARKVIHTFITGNRGPRHPRYGSWDWTVEGWQCDEWNGGKEAGCERNHGRDFIFAVTNPSANSSWEGPTEKQERAGEEKHNKAEERREAEGRKAEEKCEAEIGPEEACYGISPAAEREEAKERAANAARHKTVSLGS